MSTIIVPDLQSSESPWFNKGVLRFGDSDHALTNINGYYVCSLRQKQECNNNKEGSFKHETIEKAFTKFVTVLKHEEHLVEEIFSVLGEQWFKVLEKYSDNQSKYYESMSMCILNIKNDYKKTKKINKNDINDFKGFYESAVKATYAIFLAYTVDDCLKYIAVHNKNDAEFANRMTHYIEKVYISNNGEIIKIKPEGIMDYVIALIQNRNADYLKEINIAERINFKSLDLFKTIEWFELNGFKNSLSYFPYGSSYEEEKQIDNIFKNIRNVPVPELLKALKMYREFSTTPDSLYRHKLVHKSDKTLMGNWMDKLRYKYKKSVEFVAININ